MLNKAIKKAKGNEEQKIGVSLNMPISFKEKLQVTADTNGVSLNALIISILEVTYDDSTKSLSQKVEDIGSKIREYDKLIENSVDENDIGFNPRTAKTFALNELNKLEELAENIENTF